MVFRWALNAVIFVMNLRFKFYRIEISYRYGLTLKELKASIAKGKEIRNFIEELGLWEEVEEMDSKTYERTKKEIGDMFENYSAYLDNKKDLILLRDSILVELKTEHSRNSKS